MATNRNEPEAELEMWRRRIELAGARLYCCQLQSKRKSIRFARRKEQEQIKRERRSKNSQEISVDILLTFLFCFRNCSGVPRQENDNLWSSCANYTHLQLVVAATEAESSLETRLYTRAADPQAVHKRSTMSPPNEQPEDDFVTKVGRT